MTGVRVAVVGAGVIGLSTTVALLERGVDVTCFESDAPMSQRSSGTSRIFRLAHAVPELVELAERSRRAYAEWSERAGAQLLNRDGMVFTGPEVAEWASALAAAGIEHHVEDTVDRLDIPTGSITGPALVDPNAGVIDADGVGRYLVAAAGEAVVRDTAYRLELTDGGARVWSGAGRRDFDVCVLAAGLGTCYLANQVQIYTPSALFHHVRLTFPLKDTDRRPHCLIDRSETWRPGFTTYQHLAAPGRWAVGAHFGDEETAWELGRERVAASARRHTVDYVRENLLGVEDKVIDEVYCNVTAGWGDGYGVQRNGGVLTLYGDNLFKLAPVIGQALADAAVDGSTPESTLV